MNRLTNLSSRTVHLIVYSVALAFMALAFVYALTDHIAATIISAAGSLVIAFIPVVFR